jgi:hypothetical protein
MPGQHPIAPENVTLGQLYILILDQKHEIAVQGRRIEDLTGEVALARRETDRARQETAELLQAWRSGKGVVTLFKLLGALATAGLAIWGVWSLMRGLPASAAELIDAAKRT